ncbi:MAG: hypothetical protein M1497_01870 [Nitrospirae bacterium]|nr:hypothetical protein [Nitrospirota bacterium]
MREDHQRLIEEKIGNAEARAATSLDVIRRAMKDFLLRQKGFGDDEIEADAEFPVSLDGSTVPVSVDYIIRIGGRRFMAIKCSPGALESRDRHLVSFARVVDSYQIPFVFVTDGSRGRMLDTVSGKLVAEGLGSLPDRRLAGEMLGSMKRVPYPAERIEREKRILLAFDAIKCTEESGE